MNKEKILKEISERAPWYQQIHFEEWDVTTTDDPANAMIDAAYDNMIDGISLEDAAIQRPVPKWNYIKNYLPDISGKDVLEIGTNCGFFAMKFATAGAKKVTGIDVVDKLLENARWAASVQGINNIDFKNVDFMNFSAGEKDDQTGLLSSSSKEIPLPDNKYDLVFMSTVIDHLFFPLFSIYKMLRISREFVVIDCPVLDFEAPYKRGGLTLAIAEDKSHHAFVANSLFWMTYMTRMGVPEKDIMMYNYRDGLNICMVIRVANIPNVLCGA